MAPYCSHRPQTPAHLAVGRTSRHTSLQAGPHPAPGAPSGLAGPGGPGLCPVPACPQGRICHVAGPSTEMMSECRESGAHPVPRLPTPSASIPATLAVASRRTGEGSDLGPQGAGLDSKGVRRWDPQTPPPQDWPSGPGMSPATTRQVESRGTWGGGAGWEGSGPLCPAAHNHSLPPPHLLLWGLVRGPQVTPSRPTAATPLLASLSLGMFVGASVRHE